MRSRRRRIRKRGSRRRRNIKSTRSRSIRRRRNIRRGSR